MLHLFHNFFLLLNMMERGCQLLPLVPKKESGQWKKLRLCFFPTHLLRFSKYTTQKISLFEKDFIPGT